MNVRARRAQAITYLGGKCAQCETTLELAFVHIDPGSKLFDITTTNLRRPVVELVVELNKCRLLCPVHKKPQRWTHGTSYAFLTMKCRCSVCAPAWRAWNDGRKVQRRKPSGRGAYQSYNIPSPCGTRRKYLRGCRCGECRKANAEYTRVLRGRRCIVSSV